KTLIRCAYPNQGRTAPSGAGSRRLDTINHLTTTHRRGVARQFGVAGMPNGAAGPCVRLAPRALPPGGPHAGAAGWPGPGGGHPGGGLGRLLRRRQLVVDHVLEALEGLRARHQAAVDDEAGRAAHADRAALLHLRVHRGGALLVVEAVVPGVHVDAGVGEVLGGLLLDVVLADLGLVLEEALVELPEGVRLLLLGALRGDGARLGPRMEGQRVALVVEAD